MRVEALCDMSVFLDLKGFVCGEYVHNVGIGRSLRLSTYDAPEFSWTLR